MTIEEARQKFHSSLRGCLSGPPDWEPVLPAEEVLNTLASDRTPMDDISLDLLKEEIIDWLTEDDPEVCFGADEVVTSSPSYSGVQVSAGRGSVGRR